MPEQLLRAIKVPPHIDLLGPEYLYEAAHRTNVVIVHCTIPAEANGGDFFINRQTFLLDHRARLKYRLLHAEGIGHGDTPDVTKHAGRPLRFTLYFLGLAKDCTVFDLVERSDDLFPFEARNIQRNAQDVYHVTLCEPNTTKPTP